MKNKDKIKLMSDEELAGLFATNSFEGSCYMKWFNSTICKECPTTEIYFPESPDKKHFYNECDFQGICPHQKSLKDIFILWLNNEN